MKKALTVLVVLALLSAAGWQIWQRVTTVAQQSRRRPASRAVAVEVASVRQAAITDVGTFTGSLLPKSQFVVAAKIGGWLESLVVDVGDPVKRGQLIAGLDDDELAQQVDQAQAELDVQKATLQNCVSDLDVARREFDRVNTLLEQGIASQSEMDAMGAEVNACDARTKVSQAQGAQKQAALNAAQIRLSYAQVRASWKGGQEVRVIGERFVDDGALLKENEPIVSILETGVLKGIIHVIERDYPKVQLDQRATITTDAYPGRSFAGQIVRIAPLLRESSRQARMELEIPNPDGALKPGMFIRARIEFSSKGETTVVPLAALVQRQGQSGVFVVDPVASMAHFIEVTVGIVNDGLAEVLDPPLSGLVVTMGHHLLEDSSKIILPSPAPTEKADSPTGPQPTPDYRNSRAGESS